MKRIDPPTLFGGKIAISRSDVIKRSSVWVLDLNVARDISIAIHFAESIEGLVSYLTDVKLVVTC